MALEEYPVQPDNLVIPIIELERTRDPDETIRIVDYITKRLGGSEFDSLRRAMLEYMRKALKLSEAFPEVQLTNLQEVNTMLAARIEEWKEAWKKEGLEAGLVKGIRKAEEDCLLKLLKARAIPISPFVLSKIQLASSAELNKWFDQLLQDEKVEF